MAPSAESEYKMVCEEIIQRTYSCIATTVTIEVEKSTGNLILNLEREDLSLSPDEYSHDRFVIKPISPFEGIIIVKRRDSQFESFSHLLGFVCDMNARS